MSNVKSAIAQAKSEEKQKAVDALTSESSIPNDRTLSTTVMFDSNTETIILPEGMSKLTAAEELVKQHENEEQVIQLNHAFTGWMYEDALVAIKQVSQDTFGWIEGKTIYSFFGAYRPQEIEVVTDIVNGNKRTILCFAGRMGIGAWEDAHADISVQGSARTAYIQVTVKKKFTARVRAFFKNIELYLSNNSIYRGKSIVYAGGMFEIIENIPTKNIILNQSEERVINNLIIKALGKPGKRSVLFSGPFGTGKTETAMRIGLAANNQGLSFFYCKEPATFPELLVIAKNYQPAVIFLEDVDDIGGGEERTTDINELLNTLDGVQTKNHSLTCIFTTNHENRINPALRRPGRIDLVVKFGYLEKESIIRLYKAYFEGKTKAELDYEQFAEATPPNVQGAIVAEMAKRAIQFAEADNTQVTNDYVLDAIVSMAYQIDFLKEDVENLDTPATKLASAISDIMKSAVNPLTSEVIDVVVERT